MVGIIGFVDPGQPVVDYLETPIPYIQRIVLQCVVLLGGKCLNERLDDAVRSVASNAQYASSLFSDILHCLRSIEFECGGEAIEVFVRVEIKPTSAASSACERQ